jgi:hypothetical protein
MLAARRLSSVLLLALAGAALALPATAPAKAVRDPHALPAAWKHRFHVRSAAGDPDGDGLTNWTEFRAHTNPKRADTNRNGTSDASEDYDRDGVDNLDEQRSGTDPAKRDSDGDGRPDGAEDADGDGLPNAAEQQTGNDPSNPDSDGDGIADGKENAGRVATWDPETGALTIRLASGTTVTGTVDDTTEVTCDSTGVYAKDYDDDPGFDDAGAGPADVPAEAASDPSAADDASAAVPSADDPAADDTSVDDSVTFDEACFNDVLAPGAWVHEATLTDDGNGPVFESVALVDDSLQGS